MDYYIRYDMHDWPEVQLVSWTNTASNGEGWRLIMEGARGEANRQFFEKLVRSIFPDSRVQKLDKISDPRPAGIPCSVTASKGMD